MSSMLPKGFSRLPISSALTTALIVIPLVVSILDSKHLFILSYDPFISQWGQYWRLIIYQFQFQNESQVILSVTLLVLTLKNLERLLGSLKFLKLIVLLLIYNCIGNFILMFVFFNLFKINLFIPSGPFGLMFGLLYPGLKYSPVLYKFELNFSGLIQLKNGKEFKIVLTNDFITTLLALQLFISEGFISSTIPSLLGYFIGVLVFNDLLAGLKTKLPIIDFIYNKLFNSKRQTRNLDFEIQNMVNNANNNNNNNEHSNLLNPDVPIEDRERSEELDDLEDLEENLEQDGGDTPVRPLGSQILDTFRR